MATAYTVRLTPNNTGLWRIKQNQAAAEKASELLQKDIESHHCFFNNSGFHDHIPHHILALYGTGASSDDLSRGYADNVGYQRALGAPNPKTVDELSDWEKAKKRLSKPQYYADWLAFFQRDVERLGGWREALQVYLFNGAERADDMLVRMFEGILHPLIQLMYGIEWDQPAIVATALAQASVHREKLGEIFMAAEERARSATTPMPSIQSLMEQMRAGKDAIDVISQVKVGPEELAERTAEMYNVEILKAASEALDYGEYPKFEFYKIHHVNVCPAFIVLNEQDWLSAENKARLLEWKIRLDLLQHAASRFPNVGTDKLAAYTPKDPASDVPTRMHKLSEDGHAIKLLRAVRIGRHVSQPYEEEPWIKIKGDEMWDKVEHLVADSIEAPGPDWARAPNAAGAWQIPSDQLRDKSAGQRL